MLIAKGGNLNTLNIYGQTPLAFGSERVIRVLDIKKGIATFDKGESQMRILPKGFDNNKLIDKYEQNKTVSDTSLIFEPSRMISPNGSLTQNKKLMNFKPLSLNNIK